jgi:hypothetical protein
LSIHLQALPYAVVKTTTTLSYIAAAAAAAAGPRHVQCQVGLIDTVQGWLGCTAGFRSELNPQAPVFVCSSWCTAIVCYRAPCSVLGLDTSMRNTGTVPIPHHDADAVVVVMQQVHRSSMLDLSGSSSARCTGVTWGYGGMAAGQPQRCPAGCLLCSRGNKADNGLDATGPTCNCSNNPCNPAVCSSEVALTLASIALTFPMNPV